VYHYGMKEVGPLLLLDVGLLQNLLNLLDFLLKHVRL